MTRITVPFINYSEIGVVENMSLGTLAAALVKLKRYEDAEDHGLLVNLPCNVGDTLYAPTRNFVSEFRVRQFNYGGYNKPYLWVEWYLTKGITGNFRIDGIGASEIGKTVFLTREEAEVSLERRNHESTD